MTPSSLRSALIASSQQFPLTPSTLSADDEELQHEEAECDKEYFNFGDLPQLPTRSGIADQRCAHAGRHDVRALFLDYDGTLREFESRPELAVPTPEISELLTAINLNEDLAPHIISGRDSAFLEAHFGHLDRFTLVAEHGYLIRRRFTKTWTKLHSEAEDEDHEVWKASVRPCMLSYVDRVPNSRIEEKDSALVWHYREVFGDDGAVAAESLLAELQGTVRHGVRIMHGSKIVEVSYSKVDKGRTLERLIQEASLVQPFAAVTAIGDDRTDEFMFAAAPPDSVTIKVGDGPTNAKFNVSSPVEVRRLLRELYLD